MSLAVHHGQMKGAFSKERSEASEPIADDRRTMALISGFARDDTRISSAQPATISLSDQRPTLACSLSSSWLARATVSLSTSAAAARPAHTWLRPSLSTVEALRMPATGMSA